MHLWAWRTSLLPVRAAHFTSSKRSTRLLERGEKDSSPVFSSSSPFPGPSHFFASRPWRKGVESSRVAGRGRTTQDLNPNKAQPLGLNAETEMDRTSRHLHKSQCLFFFFSFFSFLLNLAVRRKRGSRISKPFSVLLAVLTPLLLRHAREGGRT